MKGYLGIDIGSLYIGSVLLDESGRILDSRYCRHYGEIAGTLQRILSVYPAGQIHRITKTGYGAKHVTGIGKFFDFAVSQVVGVRSECEGACNIICIGASRFSLIRLDPQGGYIGMVQNTACASGTGSFLDQQAARLGIRIEELAQAAERCSSSPPIATRCAVFAKSDMIHLQQAGFTRFDIASGLCKSLASGILDTLLKGQRLQGKTVITGGVARNRAVVKALEERIGFPVYVPSSPELIGARGAAILAMGLKDTSPISEPICYYLQDRPVNHTRSPLTLNLSSVQAVGYKSFYIDGDQTEVALPSELAEGQTYEVVMGIDIGSTSTKAVLMDRDKRVIAIVYRKTEGDPIKATKLIFKAISLLASRNGVVFNILASGTTGSGRKMIRKVIRAEIERDEITAHARAAVFLSPQVDTIIEIGGQDSKFTLLRDGVVYNCVMNYVCAAGTGSFIEEQAKKLGIRLEEFADIASGAEAPYTSDRCTVFMERDVELLMSAGFTKEQIAAAVIHSVRDNYLNKVVGGLPIGKNVVFQGATARNRALVAAFEQELKRPISVSGYCHVTGAIGIALILLEDLPKERTFKGLGFATSHTSTETEGCKLCNNNCTLTLIKDEGEIVIWGAKCGREYSQKTPKRETLPHAEVLERRERLLFTGKDNGTKGPIIGIPRSLTTYAYLPLWEAFFKAIGCQTRLSPQSTDKILAVGKQSVNAEWCTPVIVSHGHVKSLQKQGVDLIFLPHMIREPIPEGFAGSHFCPYIQAHPSVIRSALISQGGRDNLISPVIDFELGEKEIAKNLYRTMAKKLDIKFDTVIEALRYGISGLRNFQEQLFELGQRKLVELRQSEEIGVVLLGRLYNTLDSLLSLELPKKMAQMGVTIFTIDSLRMEGIKMEKLWESMYWGAGHRILRAAEYVAKTPGLFAVFLTNFGCGPDSYILTYFKHIMSSNRKPYLVLQLDQHGGDAGYITRIEAAMEAFRSYKQSQQKSIVAPSRNPTKDRMILIPPMEPVGARFIASIFRSCGYRADVLEENAQTFATGLKHVGGGECSPCPSTLGSLIWHIQERGLCPSDFMFFMPTASGPCRFGQYATLCRLVLDKKGWDLPILSPSGLSTYAELPGRFRRRAWDAILLADILRKITLKIRPYEEVPGQTDRIFEKWVEILEGFLERGEGIKEGLKGAVEEFSRIKVKPVRRPKIGVVGEIYVRNNPFLNGDIIRVIESLGGEVLMTSTAEWILYTHFLRRHGFISKRMGLLGHITEWLKGKWYKSREQLLYDIAMPLLHDRLEPEIEEIIEQGKGFLPVEFEGEAILTLGRALIFIKQDGVDAVINTSPVFCMPGTITSSIFGEIEKQFGVPIICNFYDGSGDPNTSLIPHMYFLMHGRRGSRTPTPFKGLAPEASASAYSAIRP